MKVLVCGSRDWSDERPIRRLLEAYGPGTVVIHGAARGADAIADAVARGVGFDVEPYPVDWPPPGSPRFRFAEAGHARNLLMLTSGKPDVVWAFKDGFDHSLRRGGTENMVRIAREVGVPTYVVSH